MINEDGVIEVSFAYGDGSKVEAFVEVNEYYVIPE